MPQPDEDHLGDWVAETNESIAARLEGVKAAQSKTRLTLVTMAVVSVMMLITAYNAYLSYDYNWIVGLKCPKEDTQPKKIRPDRWHHLKIPHDNEPDLTTMLTKHAMSEWASSRTAMASFLGIRVSVDDVSVLGTAVLLLFSIWLFLVTRRENHTTGFLLRDTDKRDGGGAGPTEGEAVSYMDRKRWLIYHTIISNSLFFTFDSLRNVGELPGPNSLEAGVHGEGRSRLSSWGLTVAREFFFLFPVVVAALVFILDCVSYSYLPDPFSANCKLEDTGHFFKQSRFIFVVCFIPLLTCCRKARGLSKNTEEVLRDYGAKLLDDLKKKSRPPKS